MAGGVRCMSGVGSAGLGCWGGQRAAGGQLGTGMLIDSSTMQSTPLLPPCSPLPPRPAGA